METSELRKKWVQSITEVDGNFLRMVDALHKSYIQDKTDSFDELPETVKKLLLQSIKNSEQGNVRPHKEVMAEFRKKYNIAG